MSKTIQLKGDHLYDIGGKVLSLDEIQQAVINSAIYEEIKKFAGDSE